MFPDTFDIGTQIQERAVSAPPLFFIPSTLTPPTRDGYLTSCCPKARVRCALG